MGVADSHVTPPSWHSRSSRWASACVCLLISVTGCGWWLRITEVNGTVRLDGKPATGVQLVFEPLIKDLPRAIARTNKQGSYTLGRQGPGAKSGAAAGVYRVKVMSDTERDDPIVIPPEYNVKSTLEFKVVPGKKNTFDIDITTK